MEKFIPELEQRKAEMELAEKIGDAVAEGAADTYQAIESGVVSGYQKIEDSVVSGYQKIEDSVVTGYQKIEDGAVSGFNKIADKFVGTFLTREGESVEDAKARLAAEQREREENRPHHGPRTGV